MNRLNDFPVPASLVLLLLALVTLSAVLAVWLADTWPLPVLMTQAEGLDNRFLALLFLGATPIAWRWSCRGTAPSRRRVAWARAGLLLLYAGTAALLGSLALPLMLGVEIAFGLLVAWSNRRRER